MYAFRCNYALHGLKSLLFQVTSPELKYFNDPSPAPSDREDRSDHGNSREVAAKKIQAIVRGYFTRRLVSMMLLDRVVRVWKPEIMKGRV